MQSIANLLRRRGHARPPEGPIGRLLAGGTIGEVAKVEGRGAQAVQLSNTILIERTPHDVFEFVSDLENVPRWNYAILETRKTSTGPVGVGTTYRQVRSVPTRSEESLQVTEFEPDRRLSIRGRLGPFEATLTYELEDVGGWTRLTNSADLEASGIMKLAAPIASGRIREAVAANLGALKQLLER